MRNQFGFSVDLARVYHLPGAPDHETVDCLVTFDPRGANLGTGPVEVIVPINVRSMFHCSYLNLSFLCKTLDSTILSELFFSVKVIAAF